MAKKFQLWIPEPCHENWENMLPSEQGRFCKACSKQVIDFSRMTDREIAQFFKKTSTGSLCGRFMDKQLNRDLEIPKKRIPWVRYFFQFALPAFLASGKLMAQGRINVKGETVLVLPEKKKAQPGGLRPGAMTPHQQGTPSIIILEREGAKDTGILKQLSQTDSLLQNKLMNASPASPTNLLEGRLGEIFVVNEIESTIKGVVINGEGKPVPLASISIKNTSHGVIADEKGKFNIKPAKNKNKLVLLISSVGFLTKEIAVDRNLEKGKDLVVQLDTNPVLKEVVVTAGYLTRRRGTSGLVWVIRKSWSNSFRDWIQSSVKPMIYPNPVKSNSTISIKLANKEEGKYQFEFLTMSGQLVNRVEMWIDNEAAVVDMEIPRLTAGTYLLRMLNRNTGKVYTEKIVVQ